MKTELKIFENWEDFETTVNRETGWQKLTLYRFYLKNIETETVDGKLVAHIQNPHRRYLDCHFTGLKIDGQYVGFANIYLPDKGYCEIGNFEIIEPYQRQGFGALMFSELMDAFRYKKYKECRLCAYTSDAKSFWAKLGFKNIDGYENIYRKEL